MEAHSAVTINATADVLYRAWRDFEKLPTFMYHLKSVSALGDGVSHWVARAPVGTTVEWDAEITDDVPGERLAWQSREEASVPNVGSVSFRPAPGGRGTEVHVTLAYWLPGGRVGSIVAKLFGEEPNQQIADDLRRFKQIMETGEIARSDASPLGTRNQNQMQQRSGQPLDEDEVSGDRAGSHVVVGEGKS